jgi:hypothetical protein
LIQLNSRAHSSSIAGFHPGTFFPLFALAPTTHRLAPPDREPRMDALLRRLLCCFGARRRQGRPRQCHVGHGGGGGSRDDDGATKKSFLRRAARFGRSAGVERLETPRPRRRRWPRPRGMNRVFARSPPWGTTARAVAVEPRPAITDNATAATAVQADGGAGNQEFSAEHAAAATIQAHFRGHLVRTPQLIYFSRQ